MDFYTSQEVLNLGIKGTYLTITGLQNRKTDPLFEEHKSNTIKKLKAKYTPDTIITDPILDGFRTLHTKVERSNRKYVSSPENLISMFLKNSDLPSINLLVDIYNLISLKSRLALGAHDASKVTGNVSLRLTKGNETFLALGQTNHKSITAGEYGYIDDSNEIICRLEYRQCEKTKVTLNTTNVFFIIQGNEATPTDYITETTNELTQLVKKYCGGQISILQVI